MAWVDVASVDELIGRGSLEFEARGRPYVLFRSGDAISCLDGLCPHRGGRLADGPFDGSRVTCGRKGCLRWSFDVRTGACSVGDPPRRPPHPVRVEGSRILVDLPDD